MPSQPSASRGPDPQFETPCSRLSEPKPSGSRLSGVSKLVLEAVTTPRKHSDLSLQAQRSHWLPHGEEQAPQKVLENLVSKELLRQLKGTGALDSFTISKRVGKKKEKAVPKKRGRPPKAGSRAEAWQKEEGGQIKPEGQMAFDRAWSQSVERTPPGAKAHPKRPGIWSGRWGALLPPTFTHVSKTQPYKNTSLHCPHTPPPGERTRSSRDRCWLCC
uniref:Uncharacterized protein n=1 Tax=Terrapene triunguis TaxID=2587831 RepID=A0A674IRV8_9SAUR